jgi:hypothetical protein
MSEAESQQSFFDWIRGAAESSEVVAQLVPHVVRLASLLPRIVAIAREAVSETGLSAAGETVDRLQPLTDALLEETSVLVGSALKRDAVVLEALDAMTSALEVALADPQVFGLVSAGFDAAMKGYDTLFETLVDQALAGDTSTHFANIALVLESLVRSSVDRALAVAVANNRAPIGARDGD